MDVLAYLRARRAKWWSFSEPAWRWTLFRKVWGERLVEWSFLCYIQISSLLMLVGPTLACRVTSRYAEDPFELSWVEISSSGSPKYYLQDFIYSNFYGRDVSFRIISTGRNNRYQDYYMLDISSCAGCYNLQIKSVDYRRDNGQFYCQIQAGGQFLNSTNFFRSSRPANVIVLGKRNIVLCHTIGFF